MRLELSHAHTISLSHLFENVQNELLEDLGDAHAGGLAVHALGEVAHTHQLNQLPHIQTILLQTQLRLVVHKPALVPVHAHGIHQLPQEILDLG